MHIIAEKALRVFAENNATARPAADNLIDALRKGRWTSIEGVRKIFPHADEVVVKNRKTVTVLNVGGNNWRCVVAFHYNTQIVFILKTVTHAEYSKQKWKETL